MQYSTDEVIGNALKSSEVTLRAGLIQFVVLMNSDYRGQGSVRRISANEHTLLGPMSIYYLEYG